MEEDYALRGGGCRWHRSGRCRISEAVDPSGEHPEGADPTASGDESFVKVSDELLPPGEVHVWTHDPDRGHRRYGDRDWLPLLSPDERMQLGRFTRIEDRRRYGATRAMLRRVLSSYNDTPPEAWRFQRGGKGRPEVSSPRTDLRFNVTHTRGLICVMIGRDRRLGIDVEDRGRSLDTAALARRWLDEGEQRELRKLPAMDRKLYMLQLWTLREAYLKARGIGVSALLGQIAFDVDEDGAVSARFTEGVEDQPESWHFELRWPGSHHILAVAAERGGDGEVPKILVRDLADLREQG